MVKQKSSFSHLWNPQSAWYVHSLFENKHGTMLQNCLKTGYSILWYFKFVFQIYFLSLNDHRWACSPEKYSTWLLQPLVAHKKNHLRTARKVPLLSNPVHPSLTQVWPYGTLPGRQTAKSYKIFHLYITRSPVGLWLGQMCALVIGYRRRKCLNEQANRHTVKWENWLLVL